MNLNLRATASAQLKISELLIEKSKTHFRVSLQGGGCSGLTYVFSVDDKVEATDLVVEADTIILVADKKTAIFINNSVIDWEESFMKKGFKITNPQQKTECSCGKSFSI